MVLGGANAARIQCNDKCVKETYLRHTIRNYINLQDECAPNSWMVDAEQESMHVYYESLQTISESLWNNLIKM